VTLIGALIGAVSLSGSLIAWAKLDGLSKSRCGFMGQQAFNGLVMLATLAVGGYIVFVGAERRHSTPIAMPDLIGLFFGCALVFGIADDAADRRRGYAGRDLDLQRLHRPRGRPRRLRAAESGLDDCRHGRRRRRHAC
jgi:hypothetical protein